MTKVLEVLLPHFVRSSNPTIKGNKTTMWVIAKKTCPILRHTLHADLFFGHNFCILAPNDSRFV